jgi:hypothetical protein
MQGTPGSSRLSQLLALPISLALLVPATAAAALPDHGPSELSPPLATLAGPAIAEEPPAAQDERLGIPSQGPGSLIRQGDRVLVTARFERGALSAFPELREAGAQVLSASPQTQTVTVAAEPSVLAALASVPGLKAAWPVREPIVFGPSGPCEGGAAISEGLAQLRVDDARPAFELRGAGTTVGVLSDSYDSARLGSEPPVTDAGDDVSSGDLPGPAGSCDGQQLPVQVLDEGPSGEGDEGRAMLQIVHDLAPHADLAFATAFESEESFAQNIERLARPKSEGGAGAGVIVDDVSWFEEPFFQDGPVAVAIDNVTDEGVSYFSAAGNDNLLDSSNREIASWEAPSFRDSLGCPEAVAKLSGFNGIHCMDFNPGAATDTTFGITVGPGQLLTLDLQWAEPWNGVVTDLDAFLLSTGGQLLAKAPTNNTGTQRPVEVLQWENESSSAKNVQLAINRFSGLSPRLKFILLQNGGGVSATEYPQSSGGDVVGPSVFGHAGAEAAIAVAAVPFNNSARVESYSSRGPVTHLFGPVVGPGPAPPLGSPQVISKPDLAATNCTATTFFAFLSSGSWRFCGTSAAAPHAGAVAALVRQAKPSLPPQQVRDALTDTAAPVGTSPASAAGSGLVDAFAAIASLPGPIEGGDGPSEAAVPLENPTAATTAPAPATAPAGSPQPQPLPTPTPSAPSTSILGHPPGLVRSSARSARLVFRFGSDQGDATFLCRVDRGRFRTCPARFARRYVLGRHRLQVKALGAGGLFDPTPAVFRFRVAAR